MQEPRGELAASARMGRRRRTVKLARSSLRAYAFLALALVLYFVFVLKPTGEVFMLSLYDWDGISPTRDFIGLENFRKLLADPVAKLALQHNFIWMFLVVSLNVTVGLLTAAILAQRVRGRLLFQLAYFLPVIQAPIVVALIWRWIYNPDGLLNRGLRAIGLESLGRGWLGDPDVALPALALAASWAGFGFAVMMFLAGMQGIDHSLYDAGRLDGANSWHLFRNVTMPGIRPVMTVVILLETIGAFQVFDIIWGTTQGGPLRSTEMIATYMVKRGIQAGEYGYGAAVAVVFVAIVLSLALASVITRERGQGDS